MGLSPEAWFYTFLIITLALTAILVPVLVLQDYATPYRYIFLGNETNLTDWKKYTIIRGIPPDLEQFEYLFRQHDFTESSTTIRTATQISDDDVMENSPSTHYLYGYLNTTQMHDYFNNFVELHNAWFSLEEIGRSGENNSICNIVAKKPGKTDRIVLLVGGILGNDINSALIIVALMNKVVENRENMSLYLNVFNFHFVPLLNPDGYNVAGSGPPINSTWEGNSQGVDILRNFEDITEKESSAFRQYVLQHKDHIVAAFFLFSTKEHEFGITFPSNLAKKGSDKYNYLRNDLLPEISKRTSFVFVELNDDPSRIDQWFVEAVKPKETSVFDLLTYAFRMNVTFNNTKMVDEMGEEIFKLLMDYVVTAYNKHTNFLGIFR